MFLGVCECVKARFKLYFTCAYQCFLRAAFSCPRFIIQSETAISISVKSIDNIL